MRKTFLTPLVAALLAAGSLPARAADDVIRIGVLNDQSGLYSDFGGATSVIAARMAVEDFGGKVLGKPIEILSADHQNKADVATSVARRWFDVDGVSAVADLTKIAGQKPVVTKARKAIAGFKIREQQAIGTMVTLRGARMYEFLDRFVTVALPRVRDFRGISGRSFDGRGNYNVGVKEQIIFPEIEYDKVDALRGLNISITTTAKTDAEAKALLAAFRFPFKN